MDALKTASSIVTDDIKNKRNFNSDKSKQELGNSVYKYLSGAGNKLTISDQIAFYDAAYKYYDYLAGVAEYNVSAFEGISQNFINSKTLSYGAILAGSDFNIKQYNRALLNVIIYGGDAAMFISSMGVSPEVRRGPRDPAINSNTQGKIVERCMINKVPEDIHIGQQGKHIMGHNNYTEGRSILLEDPQELLDQFKDGKTTILRKPNANKIIVDFNKPIGTYINSETGISVETTRGSISFGNK